MPKPSFPVSAMLASIWLIARGSLASSRPVTMARLAEFSSRSISDPSGVMPQMKCPFAASQSPGLASLVGRRMASRTVFAPLTQPAARSGRPISVASWAATFRPSA